VTSGPATTVDEANGPITQNKSFWAGVGIGSAALVAALMYARSPKKKK
jgi:F0F1-type ATP synthase membrane subunit c/vacuolar-type H+-ATPase subunit K